MLLTAEQIIAGLPDPDTVGQAEYRAVHEIVCDALDCYEDDSGFSPAGFAEAALDEVERAVRVIRASLNENEEVAQRDDEEVKHLRARFAELRPQIEAAPLTEPIDDCLLRDCITLTRAIRGALERGVPGVEQLADAFDRFALANDLLPVKRH